MAASSGACNIEPKEMAMVSCGKSTTINTIPFGLEKFKSDGPSPTLPPPMLFRTAPEVDCNQTSLQRMCARLDILEGGCGAEASELNEFRQSSKVLGDLELLGARLGEELTGAEQGFATLTRASEAKKVPRPVEVEDLTTLEKQRGSLTVQLGNLYRANELFSAVGSRLDALEQDYTALKAQFGDLSCANELFARVDRVERCQKSLQAKELFSAVDSRLDAFEQDHTALKAQLFTMGERCQKSLQSSELFSALGSRLDALEQNHTALKAQLFTIGERCQKSLQSSELFSAVGSRLDAIEQDHTALKAQLFSMVERCQTSLQSSELFSAVGSRLDALDQDHTALKAQFGDLYCANELFSMVERSQKSMQSIESRLESLEKGGMTVASDLCCLHQSSCAQAGDLERLGARVGEQVAGLEQSLASLSQESQVLKGSFAALSHESQALKGSQKALEDRHTTLGEELGQRLKRIVMQRVEWQGTTDARLAKAESQFSAITASGKDLEAELKRMDDRHAAAVSSLAKAQCEALADVEARLPNSSGDSHACDTTSDEWEELAAGLASVCKRLSSLEASRGYSYYSPRPPLDCDAQMRAAERLIEPVSSTCNELDQRMQELEALLEQQCKHISGLHQAPFEETVNKLRDLEYQQQEESRTLKELRESHDLTASQLWRSVVKIARILGLWSDDPAAGRPSKIPDAGGRSLRHVDLVIDHAWSGWHLPKDATMMKVLLEVADMYQATPAVVAPSCGQLARSPEVLDKTGTAMAPVKRPPSAPPLLRRPGLNPRGPQGAALDAWGADTPRVTNELC